MIGIGTGCSPAAAFLAEAIEEELVDGSALIGVVACERPSAGAVLGEGETTGSGEDVAGDESLPQPLRWSPQKIPTVWLMVPENLRIPPSERRARPLPPVSEMVRALVRVFSPLRLRIQGTVVEPVKVVELKPFKGLARVFSSGGS
jgi:hypothetical protein